MKTLKYVFDLSNLDHFCFQFSKFNFVCFLVPQFQKTFFPIFLHNKKYPSHPNQYENYFFMKELKKIFFKNEDLKKQI